MWGIHRWPVNSPHKWPVTRKMFPFDDVIMHVTRHRADYRVVDSGSIFTDGWYIDGLVQERRNSSALAMELRLSWTTHRYLELHDIMSWTWRITYGPHSSTAFFNRSVYILDMTSRSFPQCIMGPVDCEATREKWQVASIDIDFIHGDNYDQSRKKYLFFSRRSTSRYRI